MSLPASVEGDAAVRLFCALTLGDAALDAVVAWQEGLPAGDRRLVPRENLHLTLAFLGSRPAREVGPICAALEASSRGAGPIVLEVRRYRETRSVGMLVFADESGAAAGLAADLHGRLERLGVYEPERRPWLPHLTVVRFHARPRLDPPLPQLGAVSPSGAAVFLSVLRPTGARYVVVESFGLGG